MPQSLTFMYIAWGGQLDSFPNECKFRADSKFAPCQWDMAL